MAKKRRRRLRKTPIVILILIIAIIAGSVIYRNTKTKNTADKKTESTQSAQSNVSSGPTAEQKAMMAETEKWYLFLVNSENPLPEDYDYDKDLVEINSKYINGSLKQINKDVLKPMTDMVKAAWKDGVSLYVWSPYRSYDIQKMLFNRQTQRCIAEGTPKDQAEDKAATMVARPGTSEHHTGLCADFNMADSSFEQTKMFKWMKENAADYGFILRYPKDKQEITGVIYESWHWRYVTPEHAKKMNELGLCLEEYIDYLKNGGEIQK